MPKTLSLKDGKLKKWSWFVILIRPKIKQNVLIRRSKQSMLTPPKISWTLTTFHHTTFWDNPISCLKAPISQCWKSDKIYPNPDPGQSQNVIDCFFPSRACHSQNFMNFHNCLSNPIWWTTALIVCDLAWKMVQILFFSAPFALGGTLKKSI